MSAARARRSTLLTGALTLLGIAFVAARVLEAGAAPDFAKGAMLIDAACVVVVALLLGAAKAAAVPRAGPDLDDLGGIAAVAVVAAALVALHARAPGDAATVLRLALMAAAIAFAAAEVARLASRCIGERAGGTLAALGLLAAAASAPVWLGPLAVDAGGGAPTAVVWASPLSHLAAAAEYDYLRAQWFYVHTPLAEHRFAYPHAGWALAALVALGLAARLAARAFGHRGGDNAAPAGGGGRASPVRAGPVATPGNRCGEGSSRETGNRGEVR